ncbi:NAD(P)/FAD-dependent oxidoreductase [Streptomyces sp. DH37]|uniref:NAD(P)/FAD-dependent oxidoreductase n=1 Tax=Streptomyces sp. DH37 TaxID=3040122 RepID=UPI002440F679|nr:FAD-dependent oxidoreductase [Streptomyces sp. DH37]MDG9706339.1 FAD-dependent oxidoreductase [Streptomyces sp. DH37]
MAGQSVVVVGAGQAGSDLAAALRSGGFTGRVHLVGDEDAVPYRRPPLSKDYLAGSAGDADVELRPASFYADQDIDLVLGDRVVEIDRDRRAAVLASGRSLPYGRLVLAVGARPRRLPVPGADLDGVLTLRTLADARRLRRGLRGGARHVVVVGGGFVGLELAATARALGHEVTVVEALRRVMSRAVSDPMAQYLTEEHRRRGVRVLTGREVTALRGDRRGRVRVVELDGGERIPAELVVVGIGVLPRTELAADAGLAVGDGILVDGRLRTSDPVVHAIGDCARFSVPGRTRRLRLESVQNASDQARCVASVICGRPDSYAAVPWFWSEQYEARLQIAGVTDGHDRTVVAGDPSDGRFSVFCFRGERLLGAESVNRPADHMITRRLLAEGGAVPSPEEVARPDFDLREYRRRHQPA